MIRMQKNSHLNALIFNLIVNTDNNDRTSFLQIGKLLGMKLIIINLNKHVNNYRRFKHFFKSIIIIIS